MSFYAHYAFQNLHIEPGVFLGFRTRNERVTAGERSFMIASIRKALDEGDTPVKIRHFDNKNKQGGES